MIGTSLFLLRNSYYVIKIVEDIREAFAKGIRTKYIIPTA